MFMKRIAALTVAAGVTSFVAGFGKKLIELANSDSSGQKQTELLTFSEAIGYFGAERPDDPRIEKGVLMLDKRRNGTLVTWGFLNSANLPVKKEDGTAYGKRVLALKLDQELLEYFGDSDLIIFEG
jgi:hypothetical protein